MLINTTPYFGVIASMCPSESSKLISVYWRTCVATSVEIRLDGMRNTDLISFLYAHLYGLFSDKPMILALRPKSQGGMRVITPEDQWKFWNSLPDPIVMKIANPSSNVFVDWAVDLARWVIDRNLTPPFSWKKIGISDHRL
ncbi:MAG: hypothetical protein AAB610_02205 [Patescibacteria group bacterium]